MLFDDDTSLRAELSRAQRQIRRNQFYLATALAGVGVGALVAVSLLGFLSWRLGEQLTDLRSELEPSRAELRVTRDAIERTLAPEELERARTEIETKLQASQREFQTTQSELRSALTKQEQALQSIRVRNESRWKTLEALHRAMVADRKRAVDTENAAAPPPSGERGFTLGETTYMEPPAMRERMPVFPSGMQVKRATSGPANRVLAVVVRENVGAIR